jgi:hypothetical protein
MARTVYYAQNEPFTIVDDNMTITQIRDTMSEYFPELKNASHRIDGDKVYFEVKAGTKGARTVYYAQNEPFTIVDDNMSIPQIRDTMAEYFPELKNASHRIDGDKVYFEVKAGTKGIVGALVDLTSRKAFIVRA